jgi:two-component system CheB/CheR fusion protein
VITRLGFALRPEGLLFLGKAEMLLNHVGIFEPVDLKRRFFRKVGLSNSEPRPMTSFERPDLRTGRQDGALTLLQAEALLNTPNPTIVLDADDRVGVINHRAAAMFGLSEHDIGRPFQDLELSYRPAELRSHLAQVRQTRLTTWLRDVRWAHNQHEKSYLDIQIAPLLDARGMLLGISIAFNDVSRHRQLQNELEETNRHLERAYEELQSTNEELETTNEELQSTVEELETTNEELQSTNEELETMNEELQSMNDELQVSNDDLRERTAEISRLNELREAILASLGSAVLVVSPSMTVEAWNRQAEDLWGLRESEALGTHLLELDIGLATDGIRPMVRAALAEPGQRLEQTLQGVNRRGRTVDVRVTTAALRSSDSSPSGVLILMAASEQRAPAP